VHEKLILKKEQPFPIINDLPTYFQSISKQWTDESKRFKFDPIHQISGLNT